MEDPPLRKYGFGDSWHTQAQMARVLKSRNAMALYFDDKQIIGRIFAGWSEGLVRFAWNFDSTSVKQLVNPPDNWFGAQQDSLYGNSGSINIDEFARISVHVVKRQLGLSKEFGDPRLISESMYGQWGEALDPDIAESPSHPVTLAMSMVELMIQSGATKQQVTNWYAGLDSELERLSKLTVKRHFIPYAYQAGAIRDWESRSRRGIIQLPTATGKTIIGIEVMARLIEQRRSSRILVIVPSRLLANQWRAEMRRKLFLKDYVSQLDVPREKGPGIWITTAQHLIANSKINKPHFSQFDLVIIDEVHRSISGSDKAFGNLIKNLPSNQKLGLSATVPEKMAETVLGPVVFSLPFRDAITKGYIPEFTMQFIPCPVTQEDYREYMALTEKLDEQMDEILKRVKNYSAFNDQLGDDEEFTIQDFLSWWKSNHIQSDDTIRQYAALDSRREAVLDASRPKISVAAKEILLSLGNRVGFVMADRIDFADSIHNELGQSPDNVHALLAHSQMPNSNIRQSIERIARAKTRTVLISARLADEGINVPQASIAYNVSSPSTLTNLTQRLGRILRPGGPYKPKPIFHHFESIPEWGEGSTDDENHVIASIVARYAHRAQSALSLGAAMGIKWPKSLPEGEKTFESIRNKIRKGASGSQDPMVRTLPIKMKAINKIVKNLPKFDREELNKICLFPYDQALEKMSACGRETTRDNFVREYGILYFLFGDHLEG